MLNVCIQTQIQQFHNDNKKCSTISFEIIIFFLFYLKFMIKKIKDDFLIKKKKKIRKKKKNLMKHVLSQPKPMISNEHTEFFW